VRYVANSNVRVRSACLPSTSGVQQQCSVSVEYQYNGYAHLIASAVASMPSATIARCGCSASAPCNVGWQVSALTNDLYFRLLLTQRFGGTTIIATATANFGTSDDYVIGYVPY
jgi:hypothetical protein